MVEQVAPDRFARLNALLDPSPDNPHALSIFGPPASRAEARAIPLKWILVPSFCAPRLAFEEDDEGLASVLYMDLRICWEQWQRYGDGVKRARVAIQARRHWAKLVELAIGIYVDNARYPSVVMFVD